MTDDINPYPWMLTPEEVEAARVKHGDLRRESVKGQEGERQALLEGKPPYIEES